MKNFRINLLPGARFRSIFWIVGMAAVACFFTSTTALAGPGLPAFRIVTGDLRPFAVEGKPEAPGMLVEVVEAMSKRLNQPVKVEFFPWAHAMAIALESPRVAILPLTFTPERKPKYQWLVKLYRQRFVFITRAESKPVKNIDDARKLKIVVLRGSPNVAQLLNNKFDKPNIFEQTSVENMIRTLDSGMVDAIYGGDVINMDTIRSSGRKPAAYRIGMMLESGDVWLAGSSGFNDADITALRSAFETLVKNGTYKRLLKKYDVEE